MNAYPPEFIDIQGRGGHKDGKNAASNVNIFDCVSLYSLCKIG